MLRFWTLVLGASTINTQERTTCQECKRVVQKQENHITIYSEIDRSSKKDSISKCQGKLYIKNSRNCSSFKCPNFKFYKA